MTKLIFACIVATSLVFGSAIRTERQGQTVVIKAEVGPVKCVWCWGVVASRASRSSALVTSVRVVEMAKHKFERSQFVSWERSGSFP